MSEGERHLDREQVLSLLYEAEMKSEQASEVLARLPVRPSEFVESTVTGVSGEVGELDEVINGFLTNWRPERVAVLDRSVLRIGVWELRHRDELSVAVIIDSAVELAKRFSAEESAGFVNAVLDAAAKSIR